jgi:hypothetical protein
MAAWTSDELARIGTADELQIAPLRDDGTPRTPVPIWVVRDGDDLYIRSYRGSEAPGTGPPEPATTPTSPRAASTRTSPCPRRPRWIPPTPPEHLRRVLALTGLNCLFPAFDSVNEAVTGRQPYGPRTSSWDYRWGKGSAAEAASAARAGPARRHTNCYPASPTSRSSPKP